jgi:hypothetical protein
LVGIVLSVKKGPALRGMKSGAAFSTAQARINEELRPLPGVKFAL